VREAAEVLGIEDLLKRKPAQLSGGQRQRVALGRAIVREPLVFLFDEPLSNLDAKLRVQTRAEISKLHKRLGTTFIYVTHDQVEAMTMATRIAVMKAGVLHQVGSPEELYFRPENMFVAGFIGSPSMNFLPGTFDASGEHLVLQAGAWRISLPPERAKRLAAHVSSGVTVGIRPEDIYDPDFLSPRVRDRQVQATVDVAEMMGNEKFLHLLANQHTILARVDPRTRARPGEEMTVAIDVDRIHIFDPASERALDKIEIPNNGPESR
jgi:multiple sugar transport system ATP-binding protein